MSDTPRTRLDDLILELEDAVIDYERNRDSYRREGKAEARAAIVSFFSEGAKWIKAERELPDGDETVIVHGHTGYRGFGWHDGEYWRDCVTGDRFANLKLNIEHWMPLPEAPK